MSNLVGTRVVIPLHQMMNSLMQLVRSAVVLHAVKQILWTPFMIHHGIS